MAENKKKRLSRGLDAIFGEGSDGADIQSMLDAIERKAPEASQVSISLDEIRPNPYQPRKNFDQEKLDELTQSIKDHGVFQPVLLKKTIDGYYIVAGERRYRAARQAGLTTLPAIIIDITDEQMMEIALLENIQRENLNPIEEAKAYKALQERLSLTQEELSMRVGKSRAHVANTIRLLKMPEILQNYVLDGQLTMGHVKPLITIEDVDQEIAIANRAIKENLSVRQVEDIVKGYKLQVSRKKKPKPVKNENYSYAENIIRKKYRTKVKIDDSSITLKYTNVEDLNRILELMGVLEDV